MPGSQDERARNKGPLAEDLGAGLRCRVLDVRRSSVGVLGEVLNCQLYVLAGTAMTPPLMPAAYVGETARMASCRWEISYLQWTVVRQVLRASWVLLIEPEQEWPEDHRLTVEAQVIRGLLAQGGVRLLNRRTAAPGAWSRLDTASRCRALEQADAIVAAVVRRAFAHDVGGGLATSAGGGNRDATVRHLHQRALPAACERELAGEDRLRGLRQTLTPEDSVRVDLMHREVRAGGHSRVRTVSVEGRAYYAPHTMSQQAALALAEQVVAAGPSARQAMAAALTRSSR